ncbi:hypothetical protein MRX96_014791 [Rhipicephalus microplus]
MFAVSKGVAANNAPLLRARASSGVNPQKAGNPEQPLQQRGAEFSASGRYERVTAALQPSQRAAVAEWCQGRHNRRCLAEPRASGKLPAHPVEANLQRARAVPTSHSSLRWKPSQCRLLPGKRARRDAPVVCRAGDGSTGVDTWCVWPKKLPKRGSLCFTETPCPR